MKQSRWVRALTLRDSILTTIHSIAEVIGIAVGYVLSALAYLIAAIILLWTTGAIYYDVGRGRWFAWPLVVTCVGAVVTLFVLWQPAWKPLLTCLAAFTLFLTWWFSQRPSNHRQWGPNHTKLAKFDIDGDAVTVEDVRNTEYQTENDYTPHYETRHYHLSNLQGVDGVIINWGPKWLCHPFLIFDFGAEGRLAISIEVRYRVGQSYAFFPSLYRQQEIMYVVTDERDAIMRRAIYVQQHNIYLYKLQVQDEEMRQVFLEYVVQANALVDTPNWYHGIFSNCTTSIYRQRTREIDWDWRWLFNGQLDEMIYDHGRLDRSIPFEQLKRESRVNEFIQEAPKDGFGDYLRSRLPHYS